MVGDATAGRCPKCGAPLELDVEGRCRWCEAFVEVAADVVDRSS